jgi:GntR family transcriptional repressor for pyruvate dehydrogenase complex
MALVPPENSTMALERIRDLLSGLAGTEETRLPTERALSERLEVSRGAVRRALEVLEAEGVVWRRQGSGTYTGRRPAPIAEDAGDPLIAATDFMEIMEVRLRIEPPLAQLAALRAQPDEIARMREHLARINQTADADARELWDGALHRQIASSARNRLFLSLFDIVNRIRQDDSWRSVRERARTLANSRETTRGQHETIIDAIEARDPARAGEAMREHLLLIQEILIRQTSLEPPLETHAALPVDPAPVDRSASRTEPA